MILFSSSKRYLSVVVVVLAGLMAGSGTAFVVAGKDKEIRYQPRPLSQFVKGVQEQPCYDRSRQSPYPVTDLHLHSQPFGGPSIPFEELMKYLRTLEVRFALLYGIGQTLPYNSKCTYYLDCKGVKVSPGLKNDFENAANLMEFPQSDLDVRISMTFPNLAHPSDIASRVRLLDQEYPGLFMWMGEVNVNKQALLSNGFEIVSKRDVDRWKEFMKILSDRGIPLALHVDLGRNTDPYIGRDLLRYILESYPENQIIWMHMGLSRELTTLDPRDHIRTVSNLLDRHSNLSIDLSWRVIADSYFNTARRRDLYVDWINRYADRFLAGTDFVASRQKNFSSYREEVEVTGEIYRHLNDEAFRKIALGQNYFDLFPGLNKKFQAPAVCHG